MSCDVSLVRCTDYEIDHIRAALDRLLAPLGGLDWVTPGMKIVIKANLVAGRPPEDAVTTHPALLCALSEMLIARGASVVIGDSPGGVYNAAYLGRIYQRCGTAEAERYGAHLNQNFEVREAHFPEAAVAHDFKYTAYLDDADAIINCCKLKTHGMMGMTNAVKNFFGIIPGTMKPEYHYKYPKAADFADMLVDLCEYCKPRLCICDAVVGMEGNGPTQGSARPIGCLIAAQSAHKLDLAACGLIGLTPGEVPTLTAAIRRGLCPDSAEKLTIFGDPAAFTVPDYKTVPSQASVFFRSGGKGPFSRLADSVKFHMFTPLPKLRSKDCVGCKKCANICPAKAITMKRGKPRIDRKACIHCFCCQEFCPKGAMRVGRSAFAKLLERG